MNDVEQVALHFLGQDGPQDREHWIAADAPAGHADYNGGGTYRAAAAAPLEYDADHNFKLNLWSYDEPRFTQPFYFGRAEARHDPDHDVRQVLQLQGRDPLQPVQVQARQIPAARLRLAVRDPRRAARARNMAFEPEWSGRSSSAPTTAGKSTSSGCGSWPRTKRIASRRTKAYTSVCAIAIYAACRDEVSFCC